MTTARDTAGAHDSQRADPAGAPGLAGEIAPTPGSRDSRALFIAVAALMVGHAGLLAWQAYRYSPTIDEPAHLAAGISHWKFGRFDLYRVNPPLVRMVAALPMLVIEPKVDWSAFTEAPYARPEFSIGTAFANGNGFDIFWYFTLARWMCIPFSLVGGYFCYRWASDLYGPLSGLMALTLWCFCPNVLGNGALITPDVAATSFGVMASYYYWRWLRTPGWLAAAFAGVALGLALLTKSTWVILFGLWPALWIIWALVSRRLNRLYDDAAPVRHEGESLPPRRTSADILQLAALLTLALYLLNLGYGFENSFQRLDKFQFISRALGGPDAHETPGNRFANTALAALPIPVPANYLLGIDVQKYDFEKKKWSYLRGEQKLGGWWYYYLYAMGVKVPAGTLILFAMTCVIVLTRLVTRPATRAIPSDAPSSERQFPCSFLDEVTLLAPAVIVLVLVSSQTGFNRYLRYVLPCFPFVYVWISQTARFVQRQAAARSQNLPRHLLGMTPLVLLVAHTLSSQAAFPHNLAYFNELAGGPLNGSAHLLDANFDWGQDLLRLKRWCDRNPANRPLHAACFGFVKPETAGIVALAQMPHDGTIGPVSARGWYAISVNELYGYKHFGETADRHAWLRQLKPIAQIGYSLQIFCVAPSDVTQASG